MTDNNSVYVESTALVIHTLHEGRDQSVTVAAHPIDNSGDTPRLKAGHVLDEVAKAKLASILNGELTEKRGGFIDERVLMREPNRLVWYRPRQKTTMHLPDGEVTIPLPSLVFDLNKGWLNIVAFDGERRPTPDTHVRTCGLPNVSFEGVWCSGGNALPESPAQWEIERVERMFFESPFTHMSGSTPKSMTGYDDFADFYRNLTKAKRFPMTDLDHLTRTRFGDREKVTLGQWLED